MKTKVVQQFLNFEFKFSNFKIFSGSQLLSDFQTFLKAVWCMLFIFQITHILECRSSTDFIRLKPTALNDGPGVVITGQGVLHVVTGGPR